MQRRWWLVAAVLDAALVATFVAIGRGVHGKGDALTGLAATAWPFLAGLALGWAITRAWRDALGWRGGLGAWGGALAGGMALRALAGQGVDAVLVGVAAAFLALFLLGWRVLAWPLARGHRPALAPVRPQ
jgi:peptidoglycan/LPS O-acetylase OafA/YrhL